MADAAALADAAAQAAPAATAVDDEGKKKNRSYN